MSLVDKITDLISQVNNEAEKTDKRKLIDEVAGMMKSAGCSDEIIRTAIKDMEKESYDESEDGAADNKKVRNEDDEDEKDEKDVKNCGKKVKNEDEEDKEKVEEVKEDVKEDVDNKCKNSKTDFFDKMNKIYNSALKPAKEETEYVSRADRLKAGEDYFKV